MNDQLFPVTAEPIAITDISPPLCRQCSKPFTPRNGSGGKPQQFCSEQCRRQFHTANSPTPKSGVGPNAVGATKEPPEPTPHQRRSMLIAGAEDFERTVKEETNAELVDRAVAEGKVKLSAPPLSPTPESDDFDWRRDSEDVVLREQPATAIYTNPRGAIVIRQERAWDQDDDPYIIIDPAHAVAIAKQILKIADLGEVEIVRRRGGGYEDVA